MGEVEGKRRSIDSGRGGVRSDDPRGVPGKTTRTAALQNNANDMARAEVGGGFGARAESVEYAVGGGSAEARGANAVTIGGKVDFAPGAFDVDSREGRARLGEETAHAMQQSNPGAPSSVASLEGEAKQAGLDFADGRSPKVDLAAPFGVALADDPKDKDKAATKDTDPSPDVPDLQKGEADALQKVLATDHDKALALLLKALQRIDATKFSSKDLTGKKLHTNDGTATTYQGPEFKKWLEKCLDNYAKKHGKTRADLTGDEVKAGMHAEPVPKDKQDITVEIGPSYFANLSLLYSSVRHEFVHVEQIRADYLGFIGSSALPDNVKQPDSGTLVEERETEAYLWEMENLDKTGLKDPGNLYTVWWEGFRRWDADGKDFKDKTRARFKVAVINAWKRTMDAYIVAMNGWNKTFKKDGSVPDADTVVYTAQEHLKNAWSWGTNFDYDPSPYEKQYKTAIKQSEQILGNGAGAEFKKGLDAADSALKAGYTDASSAYSDWSDLTTKWINLDAELTKTYTARFKVTGPALWKQAFTLYEAQINDKLKSGDVDKAQSILDDQIDTLFRNADSSFVKHADFDKHRKDLEAAVKKAKKP